MTATNNTRKGNSIPFKPYTLYKKTEFEKFTIVLTVVAAFIVLTTSTYYNESLDPISLPHTSILGQGFSFFDFLDDISNSLTGTAILEPEVNENKIWVEVRDFVKSYWLYIILSITALAIILFLSIHFHRAKKKFFAPISNDNIFADMTPEEVKKWGKKSNLQLNHELDKVNQKLKKSQNHVPELLVPKREGKRTKKEVKKPKPTILEVPEGRLKLDEKLAKVEGELLDISKSFPKNVRIITSLPKSSHGEDGEKANTLEKLRRKIRKDNKLRFPELHVVKPKRRSRKKKLADKKAASEVKRISRKIEGKNKTPPSEFVQLEKEIAKLNRKLKKK